MPWPWQKKQDDSRLAPRMGVPTLPMPDGSTGRFYMGIVGESYRQPALRKVLKAAKAKDERGRPMFDARVECEPTNEYDPNACMVIAAGEHIGYLSRDDAPKFHKAIAKVGGRVSCKGVLELWTREEDNKEQIAARIDLCDPWKIPRAK